MEKKKRGNPNWKKGVVPAGAKPFQKGHSGNPAGGSRALRLVPLLREQLGKLVDEKDPKSGTVADAVMGSLIKEALKGNVRAQQEIITRLDGKPTERVEISGPDGGDVSLSHAIKSELADYRASAREVVEGSTDRLIGSSSADGSS